jgi:hypothetical protein
MQGRRAAALPRQRAQNPAVAAARLALLLQDVPGAPMMRVRTLLVTAAAVLVPLAALTTAVLTVDFGGLGQPLARWPCTPTGPSSSAISGATWPPP